MIYTLTGSYNGVIDEGYCSCHRCAGKTPDRNSPQERIIPVLQVTSKFAPAEDLTVYRVDGRFDVRCRERGAAGETPEPAPRQRPTARGRDPQDLSAPLQARLDHRGRSGGDAGIESGVLALLDQDRRLRCADPIEDALFYGGADEEATDFDDRVRQRLGVEITSMTGGKAPESMARVLTEIL